MNIQIPIEVFYRYEPPDNGLHGYLEVECIEVEGYSDEENERLLQLLDPDRLIKLVEKKLEHERDEAEALANVDYISKWLNQAS